MRKINLKKVLKYIAIGFTACFAITSIIAKLKKNTTTYKNEPSQKNPLEGKQVVFVYNENEPENADGVRGHLEAIGDSDYKPGFYEKYVKRGIDILLSFGGLVALSPFLLGISVAIIIDDPGPVLFTQKRLGKNKEYFKLHKFRSMKMCTPHDVPTHMLDNPEQYITKVGKFLRAHSLDELPQIWDIFMGNMSVIGPRPGLWNQDLLTSERDKYQANDVKPGLTGWAQINGRDELEIPDKAKLDGYYVAHMGLWMDIKVFLGSLHVFGKDDSVVEGGTGKLSTDSGRNINIPIAKCESYLKMSEPKKILIAGTGSYIGESFVEYMSQYGNYLIETIDTVSNKWKEKDFSKYDVVYDIAGIAHVKETEENRLLYYQVNRDLAYNLAVKAKKDGVKQFIYLSSMSVYGLVKGNITSKTKTTPSGAYGKSKLEAEELLWGLNDEKFIVSIVRPPMVYGNKCKGNYQLLRKYAMKIGVFPKYNNERSMIFIDNLSSVVRGIIHNEKSGLYFPQNIDYMCTYEMVKSICENNEKRLYLTKVFNILIAAVINHVSVLKKVFGNLTYDKKLNVPQEWIIYKNNEDTIRRSEQNTMKKCLSKKSILVLMSSYNGEKYIEEQIRSIMQQKTSFNLVLRIRDDGSTDATCNIIESMQHKYPNRIELIRGNNKGYNASFFELIKDAENFDFYALSDQDDVWLDDKIETAVTYLQKEDNRIPILYASTSYLVDDDLKPYGRTRKKQKKLSIYNTIIQNICPGHTQVMNNKLLDLLKKDIDTNMLYVYDSWIANVAMLYGKIVYDNTPHTYYRQHRGNQLGAGKGMLGQLLSSIKRTDKGDGLKYRRQIEYFIEQHQEILMKKGYYNELLKYEQTLNLSGKIRFILTGKLYRQNMIETIAFYFAVIIGKY